MQIATDTDSSSPGPAQGSGTHLVMSRNNLHSGYANPAGICINMRDVTEARSRNVPVVKIYASKFWCQFKTTETEAATILICGSCATVDPSLNAPMHLRRKVSHLNHIAEEY